MSAALADGREYQIPYLDVRSGRDGPCVLIIAAIHGNELQGARAALRMLPEIQAKLTNGRCILVPFANPKAMEQCHPHIDFRYDRCYSRDAENNANCAWPGQEDGTSAQRLVYALRESVVKEATHLLDLHAWNRALAGAVVVPRGHEPSLRLAEATGLVFGVTQPLTPWPPWTSASFFVSSGRPGVMVELSGQYGFTAQEIRRGQSVIRNYLRALGMLSGVLRRLSRRLIWVDQAEKMDVNAPVPGVFVPRDIPLGALIEEGTLLGEIVSHQTLARTAVRAARTGWLFRYGCMHEQEPEHVRPFEHAFVRLGETIATLAWASDG